MELYHFGIFNHMDYKNLIGYTATILSIVSFVPQVIKTWRTKSTKDIALGMWVLGASGNFFWVIYGIALSSIQMIIANTIIFIGALSILFLKIKYK